ncbi:MULTISPECIES: type II toxin-antitoxin system VapC family toxin [unclassified Roseateles]|uniref:type II toxin-antitoxin system VapC family toxin n=1 Tax=unclassified Roseateles TaxID=2626991 RepID=UPI0006F82A01|nr:MULTISPECIES: type II toxin-antitoxin system VapC family toxin [unclassified Roseateles]KQW41167.1 DNA-binding protein [Pelomonas sp. Root405]KRA67939.1 DNA-binding protein [Pelomonas sp. Root662]
MIAVDTSILVDYIGDGPSADEAERLLRGALSTGPVVACEVVVSEVVAGLGHSDIVLETLEAIGIGFSPLELRAALRAGEMQRRYRQRLPTTATPHDIKRTVPDFLIGAHALLQCQGLITRDAGFFRDYFKGLRVIAPKA